MSCTCSSFVCAMHIQFKCVSHAPVSLCYSVQVCFLCTCISVFRCIHFTPIFSILFESYHSLLYVAFYYVQIEDCRTRYNGDADQNPRRKRFTFPARLICGDCYEVITIIFSRHLQSRPILWVQLV